MIMSVFHNRMPKLPTSVKQGRASTLHSSQPSLNYGSFTFTDNVTNSKITMEDARRQYTSVRRESQQELKRTQAQK